MEVKKSIVINAPIEKVFKVYADSQAWLNVLPDVLAVDTLYGDGIHQEFHMTVSRPAGPETVRSIRFCEPNKRISLFQPTPPPNVKEMQGVWDFHSSGDQTIVTATRIFSLEDRLNEDDIQRFTKNIHYYLNQNLTYFKAFLERNGKVQVTEFVMANIQELYDLFWDIEQWTKVWSPIENVHVHYDDKKNQDFSMKVWRNGQVEEVRTVRTARDHRIEFNSTQTPPFLKEHSGAWGFESAEGGTIVTASREFVLDENQITAEDEDAFFVNYKQNLEKRLQKILQSFADKYQVDHLSAEVG